MKRTIVRVSLLAAAAVALSGCATFTDGDIAARVGDDELTEDQLTTIARGQLGDDDAARADMQTVSGILNNWVLDRVLRADLAANGTPVAEVEGELTDLTLTESINASFNVWQQTPPTPISDDDLRAYYELGPIESNITCSAHVLVDDEATADEVIERFDEGAPFGELATEYSTDQGSASIGGVLPCAPTGTFASQYIPEYVDAALDAEIGVLVGPVESQFGFHVIILRPYDDVAREEFEPVLATPQMRFDLVSSELDVYVNPRYGTFDASNGIVPLGQPQQL